jgi:hypothetical protein
MAKAVVNSSAAAPTDLDMMFPPRRFSGFSCPGHGRLGVGDYFLLKSANPAGSGSFLISASFPFSRSAVPEFNSEMTGR